MLRQFLNLSLRTKLIISSLVISIIPLTIIGSLAVLATRQALVNAAQEALKGAAAQTAANLDGFVQANLDAVRTEAQLPEFGEFLDRSPQPPAGVIDLAHDPIRMAAVLQALSRRDQLYILSYALLDEHGIDVMDTQNADTGVDYSNQDHFQRPVASGLPYVSPVKFTETADLPSIYFSAPIRNVAGKTVGVLRLRYNAAVLRQIVANTSQLAGDASFAVLLDENHLRLADGLQPDLNFTTVVPLDPAKAAALQAAQRLPRRPADQLSTNLPDFERGLANALKEPSFRAEMDRDTAGTGETTVEAAAVAPMSAEPWLVVFAQPEAVFLAPVDTQTRNALLIGSLATIVVALATAGGARLLTGPIVRLTAIAEKVGAGDLSAQARVEANDEIGKLAKTFNSMTAQLRQTLAGLTEHGAALRLANDRLQAELVERQRGEAALHESEAKYRSLVDEVNDGFYISDRNGVLTFANRALARILGFEQPEALIGRSFLEFVPPEKVSDLTKLHRAAMATGTSSQVIATEVVRPDGSRAFIEIKPQVILEAGRPAGNRGMLHDITGRRRAEEEIQLRLAELEAVNHISTAMRAAQTLDELLPVVLDVTLGVMHTTAGSIWLYDPVKNEVRVAAARGWVEEPGEPSPPPEKPGEGIAGQVLQTGQPFVERDFHLSARLPEALRQQIAPGVGGAVVPIRAGNIVIGTFHISARLPRELTPDEVHLLGILGEIAGNAIQRTRLNQQTEQRLQKLSALHEIDVAINASLDLDLTLKVFVDQVVAQLRVDAAAVSLLNPRTQTVEYTAGRGFRTQRIGQIHQRLDGGTTGRAALERRTIHIADLRETKKRQGRTALLTDEGFVDYYGVPLIAKGQVKGVLEIFHRAALAPDQEWLNFLDALAAQAAIVIDNATLFKDLQRSNVDQTQAYDATIAGWSRALDLRDKETEGHSQRVTALALQLAVAMGMPGEQLVHARRGALLHDIGKMGVPDSILLKPGPLTEDEWVVMRRHPQFAYDMLSPIEYLRAALDIPYCHHEKWDGTGYPQGLAGEHIPLAARVFAVVDVWDALTSDRPYRPAWRPDRVREHIQSLAGTHFDARIVKVALESGMLVKHERE